VPIQGNVEEAGVPDVLQLLSLGRKSGCLSLTDGDVQGHIYLDVGRISYASISNRADRLGDMLVKSGRITQQQLTAAVEEQGRISKRQLGRILVDSGRIDRGELERFIRLQVEQAVFSLFTWKQGTFSFASDRLPPHQPLLVSLDAESLLLEAARRVDEWSLIEKKIPSFDLVYRSTREKLGSSADGLSDEQKMILPLLDGTRDVNGLVDVTALSEFDVGKALYGLLTAGFIQLVERRAHIRHLDYRDLLAYVVREAEFADAQRRKEAARHIVDCPTCAERLRTIHVRRSTGAGMVAVDMPEALSSSAPPPAPAPAPAPAPLAAQRHQAPPPPPPPPPPRPVAEAPVVVERRARERRAGRDRRAFDRRTGLDRRATVGGPALQAYGERRVGSRRDDDRRGGGSRDRRGGEAAVQPAGAHGPRATEPRQLVTLEQRHDEQIETAVEDFEVIETAPVVAQVMAAAPEAAAQAPAPAPPAAAVPASHGAPAAAGARTPEAGGQDMLWLVTPHESLEMIRASYAQQRPAGVANGADKVPSTPPPRPMAERRAPAPSVGGGGGGGSGGGSNPPTEAEARRLERFRGGAGGLRATDAARAAKPAAPRQTFPLRSLAVAAGLACVALIGYMAGQLGRRDRAGQTGETTEANTLAPTAAQAQARAPSRANESRGKSRVPVESAERGPAPSQPAAPPSRTAQPGRVRAQTPLPAATVAAAPAPRAEAPPAAPAPTVGVIRGVVRDAAGGTVAGARVSVRGTTLAAVADGAGTYEIRDVPDGPVSLQASADGFVAGGAQARATAGAVVSADLTLARIPPPAPVVAAPAAAASEPDRELAAGGWAPVGRADATTVLGGTLGAIQGLSIESITQSTSGTRTRIRIAQITASGERIVLTETRAGAAVRGGSGPAVVTALRVMPASEAYPWSTGTASLGNILVTVKTKLAADALRPLLQHLGEISTQ